MKIKMNSAIASKINWTQIFLLLVNILATVGFINSEYLPHALAAVNILGPVITIVFRSFFTAPVSDMGP